MALETALVLQNNPFGGNSLQHTYRVADLLYLWGAGLDDGTINAAKRITQAQTDKILQSKALKPPN